MSTTFREQGIFFTAVLILIASVVTVLDPPADDDVLGTPVVDDEHAGTDTDEPGEPEPTASTAAPSASPTAGTTGTPSPGASATDVPSSDPTDNPSGQPTGGSPPRLPYEANLYSGAANTQGITDDLIRFCGHAALSLGAAFDTSEGDLNVYWEEVSATGGVYDRDVEMTWEDDLYSSDGAISAVTACDDKDPFMILGGIGFDQIPGARNEAERREELYLHHIAVAPESQPTYSFTLQPTVQQTGRAFGEYLASTYGNESIGIIYRQSPNWDPGRQTGADVLRDHGIEPKEVPVQQNQAVYRPAIEQVRDRDVVWIWENALTAANIIQQAWNQDVRPKWVVFPFQTTLDLITDNQALNPTIDGVATWPSYVPGGYGGAWSQFDLQAEIDTFEAAYAKHRPNTTPNDILFQVWVGNKVLHELLLRCGPDCTRNRFAGMLEEGLKLRVNPACAIDTTGASSLNGRLGGHEFLVQETFDKGNGPGWKTNRWCNRSLL